MERLAIGLGFLNYAKVLHRDLKPSNVMIEEKEKMPKIIDFGSANSYDRKIILEKKLCNPCNLLVYTVQTSRKYNFFYSELPKALKDSIDCRSYEHHKCFDAHSFGVMLFDAMKLNDQSSRVGKNEYIWENMRWLVSHTALMNPNDRIDPLYISIFLKELLGFYNHWLINSLVSFKLFSNDCFIFIK